MKRACPVCAHPQPCPNHPAAAGQYGQRNPRRDLAAHNRWARALKRAHPYCSMCGATTRLIAHHTQGIDSSQGIVVCTSCHKEIDPHA